MKQFFILFIGYMLSCTYLMGQAATKQIDELTAKGKTMAADTAKKGNTKFGGIVAINLSQQNSSYWVGANERYALNVGMSADLYANSAWKQNTWDNTLKMNYAWLNNESQGVRKTTDFIDLYTKYGHKIGNGDKLFAALIGNLRTQFTNGYDYNSDPRRRTSGFFAPATILLTPGIEWRPTSYFSLFASPVAGRWIIVSNDPYSYSFPNGIRPDGSKEAPISELYGVNAEDKVDQQLGGFVSASFNKEILKNVVFTSRLDLFSNYKSKPENVDIFWTNNLVFKVNKYLAIQYQWNIAYDDDFTPEGVAGPRTQFLGNLGIGITGKF